VLSGRSKVGGGLERAVWVCLAGVWWATWPGDERWAACVSIWDVLQPYGLEDNMLGLCCLLD
jgi:hypothetical protein